MVHGHFMSHDIFKPSNLIGCLENKTADLAQTRKCAIVTRPFPSPGGQGLGTRLACMRIESCGPYVTCTISVRMIWSISKVQELLLCLKGHYSEDEKSLDFQLAPAT